MSPAERDERAREAGRRLQALRHRASRLRARAVVLSLVAFALLWAALFGQMLAGKDPVLGNGAVARAEPTVTARPESRSENAGEADDQDEAEPVASEAEQAELEATELEQAQLEAAEAAELEAVTTGQS